MKRIELAGWCPGDAGMSASHPLPGARGKKAPGLCPQCGHSLIRGFGVSVCENLVCDSLPENIAPAASVEAWMGL